VHYTGEVLPESGSASVSRTRPNLLSTLRAGR
jgi:hypothetical protein